MKILFLYVPAESKSRTGEISLGPMVMPLGFPALADLVARMAHEVEILHCGLERISDAGFDPGRAIKAFAPDVVALSLHFHHQLSAVRDMLKTVKSVAPEAATVLGGFTASFFCTDIIEKWPEADYVVRGDGEAPLYHLVEAIRKGDSLEAVAGIPNLVFRSGGRTVETAFTYSGGPEVLDRLVFTNLSLLRNSRLYRGGFSRTLGGDAADISSNRYHYLCAGRGCSVNCAYCAGASKSQKRISNRAKPVFRSAESLADEIEQVTAGGTERFYVCFDPPRRGAAPYTEMMDLLREKGVSTGLVFESYRGLPSDSFIRDFANTFQADSSELVFSPASASEESRRFYNGVFYENEQLEKKLALCADRGINTKLYFTVFPDEGMPGAEAGAAWAEKLARTYSAKAVFMPIEMEPGSPWHLDPGRFGIRPRRNTFEDFIANSKTNGYRPMANDPGYDFKDFRRIMKMLKSRGLTVE